MSNKLKVAFDDPQDGWVGLKLSCGEEVADIIASYTPHDSFLDLVNALYHRFLYEGESKVIWNEEHAEYELVLSRVGSLLSLDLMEYSNHRRELQPVQRLRFSGSYEEVALPFWRALRDLQGRFSSEELRGRWHRDFPSKEIEGLTLILQQAS